MSESKQGRNSHKGSAKRTGEKPLVILYNDGACSGNLGPGGWGVVMMSGKRGKELSGGEQLTTNNRMEMKVVVEVLKALKIPCHVKIHSDSALIINAFNQGWIRNWQRTGWKKSDKKPVEIRYLDRKSIVYSM